MAVPMHEADRKGVPKATLRCSTMYADTIQELSDEN